MVRTVFFADLLGFSPLTNTPNAQGAVDALSDMASIFGDQDAILAHLKKNVWAERFALSDSVFLVSDDPLAAASTAADLFFALAYLNVAVPEQACLIRGALAMGDVRTLPKSIFPEVKSGNLVGEAVVRAVRLEGFPLKGPRLFVASEVAAEIKTRAAPDQVVWILDQCSADIYELLWLLPPERKTDGLLIGDVAQAVVELFLRNASNPKIVPHYVGYLDVVTRSLSRLRTHLPDAARRAIGKARLDRILLPLERLLVAADIPELRVLQTTKELLG